MSENTPSVAPTVDPVPAARSTEKVVWWVVFGALTLGIIGMLGAWN